MSRPHSACWNRLGRHWTSAVLGIASLVSLGLAGCTWPTPQPMPRPESPPGKPGSAASSAEPALTAAQPASLAATAKDYRQDAARHVYGLQKDKIFRGRLPPMLYAIGVLNVDIDRRGHVQALKWSRAPRHAPEVMAEIERMVHAAAPFPVPARLGKVTYTDVWLWDKSGRFQLDTLTEGQD